MRTGPSVLQTLKLVRNAKILVVGAGGLGCHVLKYLARSEFSEVHIVDADTLELSNLNRQVLYDETDVGKFKADVAAAKLNPRGSGAPRFFPHTCFVQSLGVDFLRQVSHH